MAEEPVMFTAHDAGRIGDAVKAHERASRKLAGPPLYNFDSPTAEGDRTARVFVGETLYPTLGVYAYKCWTIAEHYTAGMFGDGTGEDYDAIAIDDNQPSFHANLGGISGFTPQPLPLQGFIFHGLLRSPNEALADATRPIVYIASAMLASRLNHDTGHQECSFVPQSLATPDDFYWLLEFEGIPGCVTSS